VTEWDELVEDSRHRWEANALFWDDYMGDESNAFHRQIVRPATEELLAVEPEQTVLDIGCGNGNFSRRLAELGARVVGFDFSARMVERARQRSAEWRERICFRKLDATDYEALVQLGHERFILASRHRGSG